MSTSSGSSIARYERGEIVPSVDAAVSITEALGVRAPSGRLGPVAVGLDCLSGDGDRHMVSLEVFQDFLEVASQHFGGIGLGAAQSHMPTDRICPPALTELPV